MDTERVNGLADAATLIKQFYRLQEERVQTYKLFEEGFTAYLYGAPNYNFPMYRNLVHEITQAFKGISEEILNIEKKLREEYKSENLTSIIRQIQDEEKNKLDNTASLQLTKQNVVDHPDNDYDNELTELKQSINTSVEKITEYMEELKFESEDLYNRDGEER